MALGSTQPLTEMSTRNLPGGKERAAHKADNLTASVNPLSRKCGNLNISQPYGSPRPATWNSFTFMEPEGSLLCSQDPSTGP
jgi:hypothetical protein